METKEYKASPGKTIIELENFAFGNTIICRADKDLDVIEVSEEDARYYFNAYREAMMNAPIEESVQETPILKKGRLMKASVEEINLGNYEDDVRVSLIEELIAKGYDVNNKVEPIIHELK